MFIAPGIRYGIIYTVPWFVLSGLPDSSNRVFGLNDQSCFLILGAAYSSATRAVACFSAREESSVIPLTVMMPRGPGILSVR